MTVNEPLIIKRCRFFIGRLNTRLQLLLAQASHNRHDRFLQSRQPAQGAATCRLVTATLKVSEWLHLLIASQTLALLKEIP